MNLTIPVILILVSIGIFFTFIDPKYESIQGKISEKNKYIIKEQNLETIRKARNDLTKQYNKILPDDILNLEKLLPNHMDNVELIVDMDRIAKKDNIRISEISIANNNGGGNSGDDSKIKVDGEENYNSVDLSFSFITSYSKFKMLLSKIRRSLRLVDIVSVQFDNAANKNRQSSSEITSLSGDNYKFSVVIRAYWLKK